MRGRDLRALRNERPRVTQAEVRAQLRWDKNKLSQIELEDVLARDEDEAAYIEAVRICRERKLRLQEATV